MIVSLGLLFSTVNLAGTSQMEVPFSTPSGQAGNVQLSFPTRFFAGEVVEIIAKVTLTTGLEESDMATMIGRLEAGFEEMNPAGEVRINLQSGSPVEFYWVIRTARDAAYPGHVWLWLETNHSRELILAREFVLESRFYLGRQVRSSRVLFASLLLISSLAFLLGPKQP